MFHSYSAPNPIIKDTRAKIVTQIPGIFRNNYIEKHETHQHVKLSLFVHKFGYGYDIHLRFGSKCA